MVTEELEMVNLTVPIETLPWKLINIYEISPSFSESKIFP